MDQPCTELMCRHKVHTECFFRRTAQEDILNLRCSNCRDFIVSREMIDEAEAIHGDDAQDEAIRYFWEHEPNFKAGLEGLRQARVASQKANTIVGRKEKQIKEALDEEIEPLVEQIHEKIAAAKASYKDLPEKKEADKLSRQYMTRLGQFTNRWGVRLWRIQRALRNVAAVRTLIGNLHGIYRRRGQRNYIFNVNIH